MNRLAMMLVWAVCLPAWALAADVVEVSVRGGEVTQHEATHLGIDITNGSQHPILLDRIEMPGTGAAYTWQEQVYGSLSYSEGDDLFIHNRMAQMASQLKLSSAIVPPNVSVHHAMPLTVDESGPLELTVVLSYNPINSDKLAARIYLPRDTSPLEARYTPATLRELAELRAPGSVSGLPLHFATRDLSGPRQVRARITVTVKEAEFPLQEAMQRVSVTSHEYDADTNTWLLDTRNGMWAVARDRAEFVPGLGSKEHRFIADSGDTVPFWFLLENLPEGVRDEVKERIAGYEPEEGMGLHFDVPAGDVPGMASDLTKLGLRLELSDFQLTPVLAIRPIED